MTDYLKSVPGQMGQRATGVFRSNLFRFGLPAVLLATLAVPALSFLFIGGLAASAAYVIRPLVPVRFGRFGMPRIDLPSFTRSSSPNKQQPQQKVSIPSRQKSNSSNRDLLRKITGQDGPERPKIRDGKKVGEPMVDLLVDRLRAAGLTVTTDWESSLKLLDEMPDNYQALKDNKKQINGFVFEGVIHINPKAKGFDTPIHEYTHIWAEVLRQKNPEEWKNIVEMMKDVKVGKGKLLWDTVKEAYPHLESDDEIADEVLATYSGKHGASLLKDYYQKGDDPEQSVGTMIENCLKRFWTAVAEFFGMHYQSAEDVADNVMADLLKGVNPLAYADNDKQLFQVPRHSVGDVFNQENRSSMNKKKDIEILTGEDARRMVSEILSNAKEVRPGDTRYDTHVGCVGYFPDMTSRGDKVFSAFDNTTADCWCEDFKTEQGAQRWCAGLVSSAEEVRSQEEIGVYGLPQNMVETIVLDRKNLDRSIAYEYDLGADEVLELKMQFEDGKAEEMPVRNGTFLSEDKRLKLTFPTILEVERNPHLLDPLNNNNQWRGMTDRSKVMAIAERYGIASRLNESQRENIVAAKIAAIERILEPYMKQGDHQTFFRAVMDIGEKHPSMGLLMDNSGYNNHQMVYQKHEVTGMGQNFVTNMGKPLKELDLGQLDSLLNGLGSQRNSGKLIPAVIREVIDDELSSDEDVFMGVTFDKPYDEEQQAVGDRYGCETHDQEHNECVLPDFDAATNYAFDNTNVIARRGDHYREIGEGGEITWHVTVESNRELLVDLACKHGGDADMTSIGTPLVMAYFGNVRDAKAFREETRELLQGNRSLDNSQPKAVEGKEDGFVDSIILNEKSFEGLIDQFKGYHPKPPYTDMDKNGELEVEMEFHDGYARDLNPRGLGMYDRIGLYYPTVKEVMADPDKQAQISRYTGREWSEGSRQEQIFDIALKFGQASRVHCPKERFDAAVDAVIERTTDRHARRFTPEQRKVIMLAANCNGEDEYTGQFREVFFEQLHGKAREQMDGVNKAWIHDSLEELRDLANGEVREAARGLHR